MSSRQYAEFQAYYEHVPFGQHALSQQLAIFVDQLLQVQGAEPTDIEDLLFSPYEFKRKHRDFEDLDDDELEEIEAQQAEDFESVDSDLADRRAETRQAQRRAEREEL